MDNIEIDYISKKDLESAINDGSLWKTKPVIFPKSKANWIINNPRIDDNDYCAIIAKDKNAIIGFIYLVPDILQTSLTSTKKAYWILRWWMHEKYVGNILSTYLYNEALRVTNNQVLIRSYAENATQFYEKMPFSKIKSRIRYTIFFSLDSSILIGRFKFLKTFKWPIKLLDQLSGKVLRLFNTSKTNSRTKGLQYEYLNEIDDETWAFIEPLCKTDLILKTKEYINWQLDIKQYTHAPLEFKAPYKILEPGVSGNISVYSLKVISNDKLIGFISFLVNYNELNIKYFLVDDEQNYNLCVDALMENFIKLKCNFIFTDDDKLSVNIIKRYKTVFTYKVEKNALSHKELQIKDVQIKNQDGHFY